MSSDPDPESEPDPDPELEPDPPFLPRPFLVGARVTPPAGLDTFFAEGAALRNKTTGRLDGPFDVDVDVDVDVVVGTVRLGPLTGLPDGNALRDILTGLPDGAALDPAPSSVESE